MAKGGGIPKNALDRAIEAISPAWAMRRMRQRAAMAVMGGYIGGSRSRAAMAGWTPAAGDADSEISPDLIDMRARTRDLARNSPIGAGAINTAVTNVVGTGLSLQSQIDGQYLGLTDEQAEAWKADAEREFLLWSESSDCDITRTQNLYGLQELTFRSVLESGDTFVLLPQVTDHRPDNVYGLAVQIVEADRVSNPNRTTDKPNLVAGVEMTEFGTPIAYHITRQHPGAQMRSAQLTWDRRAAFGPDGRRAVLHLYDKRRPGQSRGVPYLAPVIESLKQLSRYSEAELSAAVVSAAFAVFVKMDAEAFQTLFDDQSRAAYTSAATAWNGDVNTATLDGPGKAVNLLPGEDIVTPALGRPNDKFDPFVRAVLRQIGVAIEIPFEVLTKHFTSSYSAARAALLDAWRFFRKRRDWLASYFCQPIYELFLEYAIANGRLSAPGFFDDPMIRKAYCAAVWVGDGPGSIDPQKEVAAADDRIALGISTREAESILHDGVSWERKHKQLVKEQRMRREDGLAAGDSQPPKQPQDDEENNDQAPEQEDE